MQCICLIGRQIQVGTTIRQGKKGGYTSVNLCVKQARPGSKVAPLALPRLSCARRLPAAWMLVGTHCSSYKPQTLIA